MKKQEIENAIKGIDAMLAGWGQLIAGVLVENTQQASSAFDTAQNALALVQLKEYFKQELAGRPYDRIYPRIGTE